MRNACFALLAVLAGCSRSGPEYEMPSADAASDAARPRADARGDARTADADARLDAPQLPPECLAPANRGSVNGSVPIGAFSFTYLVAGVEPDGSHSCPRVFLRAGLDPRFERDHLDLEVPYPRDAPREPGRMEGNLTVYLGGETWTEKVFVIVGRADGLFTLDVPYEEQRVSLSFSHHDATSDIEATASEVPYCNIFSFCI